MNDSGGIPGYKHYLEDFKYKQIDNLWNDTSGARGMTYVVETSEKPIERCILMTTDPGDLVLDPTCGSGTTAYVAEQWGRRWITIDTSRVALALARTRIMAARYPYYLLADSREGQLQEAKVTRRAPSEHPTHERIRQGFVYERVPHITLKQIANNAEIDVIWETHQSKVTQALDRLNRTLQEAAAGTRKSPSPRKNDPAFPLFAVGTGGRRGQTIDFAASNSRKDELPTGDRVSHNALLEWEVPRDPGNGWPSAAQAPLAAFWEARLARQQEIDASIAANAPFECLYDKPYKDKNTVRVAGPFTVESASPHRWVGFDERGQLLAAHPPPAKRYQASDRDEGYDFAQLMLEQLRRAGIQQAHREDRIAFTSIEGWTGRYICAEGRYERRKRPMRAGIMIGPEFGTVSRPDLAAAAREAIEAGFDALIACAFAYDPSCTDFAKLGRMSVLKARMNADLHMATDLQETDTGNLFVIFGEPDIEVEPLADDQIRVRIRGIDVYDPGKGEVRSDDSTGIACWFIDTDYNEESFFVRHAYFPGASKDPYKALKTSLRAEISQEAWATLRRNISRPFPKPKSGRIAVKAINHLGDEAVKVLRVE